VVRRARDAEARHRALRGRERIERQQADAAQPAQHAERRTEQAHQSVSERDDAATILGAPVRVGLERPAITSVRGALRARIRQNLRKARGVP
jgi:hypothetical protein